MLKKMTSMSKGIHFLIGLIRRMRRRYRSPSIANKKRKARVALEILKKPKSSTALVIQE
jgi:hypothetical protein